MDYLIWVNSDSKAENAGQAWEAKGRVAESYFGHEHIIQIWKYTEFWLI